MLTMNRMQMQEYTEHGLPTIIRSLVASNAKATGYSTYICPDQRAGVRNANMLGSKPRVSKLLPNT